MDIKEVFTPDMYNVYKVSERAPVKGDHVFIYLKDTNEFKNGIIDKGSIDFYEYAMFTPEWKKRTDLWSSQEYRDALKANDDGKSLIELIRPIYDKQ